MLNSSYKLDPSNPRNYGFSDIQSSSSLQNSNHCYTIPKNERFMIRNNSCMDLSSTIDNLNHTKNDSLLKNSAFDILNNNSKSKGCSFGLGNKLKIFKVDNNMPGPGSYNIRNNDITKPLSMFGKYSPEKKLNNPAPGYYNIIENEKSTYIPISISGRFGFYYDDNIKNSTDLGPGQYNLNYVENSRFKSIGIGKGNKEAFKICKFSLI